MGPLLCSLFSLHISKKRKNRLNSFRHFFPHITDKRRLHQTGISITVLLVGKQPTCTGDRLADVSQGAQVGLLGLVTVFSQQCVHHLVPQVSLQLSDLDLVVGD